MSHDLNLTGTGVDAVLDEFLHYGSGPLHHFAGRDLAGDGVWQQSDPAHSPLILDFGLQIAKKNGA